MIEPMKKVVLLMSAASREPSLEDLRRLGVVHLHQPPSPPAPLSPAGEGSEQLRLEEKLGLLRDALALVPPGSAIPPDPPFSKGGTEPLSAQLAAEGLALASQLLALHHDLARGASELAALRRQRDEQAVLGRFDPQDILTLREASVFVGLYVGSRRDWKTYSGRLGVERIEIAPFARRPTARLTLTRQDEDERGMLPIL